MLSNFTSEPRRGETEIGRSFFESLGYEVHLSPHRFEGEAELIALTALLQRHVNDLLRVRDVLDRGVRPDQVADKIGKNPWYVRERLLPFAWKQRQTVDASHLVVFAARRGLSLPDVERHLQRIAQVRGVTRESLQWYADRVAGFFRSPPPGFDVDDWAARQTYLALGFFLQACALLGVDTVPMEGLEPAKFDEVLGLPAQGYGTVCAAAAGYRALAIVLTVIALIGYSRQRNNYPRGMTIAGVQVGGVDPQIASERVLQVYTTPIEVQYGEAIIHVDPSVVGFELDMDSMMAAADLERTGGSFWRGFWSYLWNSEPHPIEVPLSATIAEDRLRAYLQNEISARYDEPAARRAGDRRDRAGRARSSAPGRSW